MKLKSGKTIAPSRAPGCIAKGVLAAMIITLAGACVMSAMIVREILQENAVGYSAMAILLVSSGAATLVSSGSAEKKGALLAIAAAGGYTSILLCMNALLYKGGYEGVGATLLVILGGCIAGLLLGGGRKKRSYPGKRKRKSR